MVLEAVMKCFLNIAFLKIPREIIFCEIHFNEVVVCFFELFHAIDLVLYIPWKQQKTFGFLIFTRGYRKRLVT